ncbi:MAG TPA: fibronectin type III domain-containing protein, partial [Cytophagales bacterium]
MVKFDTLRRTFLAWRTAARTALTLAALWTLPAAAQETGVLLAGDAFDAAPGALHGTPSGTGWSEPWVTQNGDLSVPGYNVATAAPLSYRNLVTAGGYATGGKSYLTAYRGFDKTAAGPFADYLAGGAIGAAGKTVWLSALLRLDANNNDERSFSVYTNFFNDNLVAAGYFGTPSNDGATRYWSLKLGASVYRTGVPVVVGQTALLVVKITFGAPGNATLYVNPTALGGAEPAAASAEAVAAGSLAFKGLAFYGGTQPGLGSLDEVRVGTTFAAVTPAVADNEAPSAVADLAAPTVTDKSVRLTWGAATDNVRVDGYDVYNGTTLLGTTAALEFNVTGLAAATAYTFTVKAKDGAGNQSTPATVNVTTKSAVKFTVQGTKILDPNGNEFLIKGANV